MHVDEAGSVCSDEPIRCKVMRMLLSIGFKHWKGVTERRLRIATWNFSGLRKQREIGVVLVLVLVGDCLVHEMELILA